MIPLYKFDDNNIINRIINYNDPNTIKQFKITSLVNPQKITNIAIIPNLNNEDDYILAPKEIKSINISRSKNRNSLFYEDIPDFDSTNRYRLNEPFLSAIIEFTLRNITDIGVPDYSKNIQDYLKKKIVKIGENNQHERN